MKKFITILSVTALIFGFASCNKCVTCTYEDGLNETEEICENDYETKLEYDLVVGFSEGFGAVCE